VRDILLFRGSWLDYIKLSVYIEEGYIRYTTEHIESMLYKQHGLTQTAAGSVGGIQENALLEHRQQLSKQLHCEDNRHRESVVTDRKYGGRGLPSL
jgi:hypothetical protein